MVGHFFGSVTTVEVLRHEGRFKYVSQGIDYDIWGMAVRPAESDPQHRIQVPLLGINSEAFMYWPDNFRVANAICEEVQEQGSLCWMMTIRGTVHISYSDFCLLYPHIASVVMKTTIDPVRALNLNIDASLDFLSRVLPLHHQPFHRCLGKKKLLDLPCLNELLTEHAPTDRWMAIRLRIPHEARKRMTLSVRKKRERYWARMLEQGEKEVWLHVRPNDDQLRRFDSDTGGKKRLTRGSRGVERSRQKKTAPFERSRV